MAISGLFSKIHAGLHGGVSQQAPVLRTANQAEVQVNGFSSLVHGLYKRPPTSEVKALGGTFSEDTLFHGITRDQDEKYILAISPNGANEALFTVLGLEGQAFPVVGTTNYFKECNPKTDVKVTTMADYTVLANNKVLVKAEVVNEAQSTLVAAKAQIGLPSISTIGSAVLTIEGVTYETSWDNTSPELDYTNKEEALATLRSLVGASGSYIVSAIDTNNSFVLQKTSNSNFTITQSGDVTMTYTGASTISSTYDRFAYVYVAKGVAEQTYSIKLNDTIVASYSTGTTNEADTYKTTNIASQLYTRLVNAGWLCSLDGNVIQITAGGTDFSFDFYDTWGGEALRGFKGINQSFATLPSTCFDGATVKIEGSANTDEGEFWVRYEKSAFTDEGIIQTQGAWKEHREPNIEHKFDYSTMPHQLVRRQDVQYETEANPYGIYFSLEATLWSERLVGDYSSAPLPSFVDSYIQDLVLFRNRLGVISGQAITLSRIGDFFNFFPTTVTDVLEDDPMDIEASSNEASVIRYAIPVEKNLLLFGDEQQFILTSGDNPFSLSTAQMFPALRYSFDTNIRPVAAAQTVYFADPIGNSVAIREYFIQTDTVTYEAPAITSHVPQLIPRNASNPLVLFSVPSQNILGTLVPNTNELFIYKYEWQGNQKVQSSWSPWTLSKNYLSAMTFNDELYLISANSLDKIDLSYDSEAVLLDNGTTPYEFKYEFSPLLLQNGEGNVGDVSNSNKLRRLLLNVKGEGEMEVNLKSLDTGNILLRHLKKTTRRVQSFLLRGNANTYTVELINNSDKQTIIESATFDLQVNRRADQLG